MRTNQFACTKGPGVRTKSLRRAYEWQGRHADADAGCMDAKANQLQGI